MRPAGTSSPLSSACIRSNITGQLIKKIVAITQKVEHELAQLLLDNAPPELVQTIKESPESLMQGPSTNALEQDDVDSLLEGLGF